MIRTTAKSSKQALLAHQSSCLKLFLKFLASKKPWRQHCHCGAKKTSLMTRYHHQMWTSMELPFFAWAKFDTLEVQGCNHHRYLMHTMNWFAMKNSTMGPCQPFLQQNMMKTPANIDRSAVNSWDFLKRMASQRLYAAVCCHSLARILWQKVIWRPSEKGHGGYTTSESDRLDEI